MEIVIDGASLTLDSVAKFARDPTATVRVAPAATAAVRSSRGGVEQILASGAAVPGVSTGFGPLAEKRPTGEQLAAMQRGLILARAAGLGPLLPPPETRLFMLLRANSLAKGLSGVRAETLEALVALLNSRLIPAIPLKGSAGAGDRAPLAHLAAALAGEGTILAGGRPVAAEAALAEVGLRAVVFQPREAAAFTTGGELAAAIGARVVMGALALARQADIVAALTMEALAAPEGPLDQRVQAARPHAGQEASARNLRRLIAKSAIRSGQKDKRSRRAGLAHSVRCTTQVHGGARDALGYVEKVIAVELNAWGDEVAIIPGRGPGGFEALAAGNFHGAPVALALDVLALALGHLGAVSERRTAKLLSADSGLPAALSPREPGAHAGLLEAHVTAAALAAETRGLARPASLDSMPTSDLEDLLGLGAVAARKARDAIDNVELILATELVAAVQGLDLLPTALTTKPLEAVRAAVRDFIPRLNEDRSPAPDVARAAALLRDGVVLRRAEEALGESLD